MTDSRNRKLSARIPLASALLAATPCCGAQNFLFAFRSRNFDRCHSLGSLLPPPAALPSLPPGEGFIPENDLHPFGKGTVLRSELRSESCGVKLKNRIIKAEYLRLYPYCHFLLQHFARIHANRPLGIPYHMLLAFFIRSHGKPQ